MSEGRGGWRSQLEKEERVFSLPLPFVFSPSMSWIMPTCTGKSHLSQSTDSNVLTHPEVMFTSSLGSSQPSQTDTQDNHHTEILAGLSAELVQCAALRIEFLKLH